MALEEEYYYHYGTAPAPTSVSAVTPYQQYLQSRGTWQLGDNRYSMGTDTESWMMQDGLMDNESILQHQTLETRQQTREPGERQAHSALSSWKMEKIVQRPSISRLNLSTTRGSTVDLKDFLHSRGKVKLEGLHLAAARNDTGMITAIIKREGPRVRINELDENECTPLMYAVLADSIPALELLLHCGAKREETDSKGRTAVHYAAFFGKTKALKFLIESASRWMPRDIYGRTPLHWSSANKDTKCLQALIKHSLVVMGDANVRDYEGMCPLHCAAQYCKPRHVHVLYEADCDFTIVDIEGKTALHWTVDNPDSSCIEVLVYCFPSLLNVKDSYGQTILHLTAKVGATYLVESLLNCEGIEIDAKDANEQTAIHVAAMAGQPGPIQLLMLHNALDSCIDASGLIIPGVHNLFNALSLWTPDNTKQLVLAPNVTHIPSVDDSSYTPLMLAASNGQVDLINLLLSNEKIRQSINQTDPQGNSALHLACEAGADDCVVTLMNKGAHPNLKDKAGKTPLTIVCDTGNDNCVGPLIEGGADIQLLSEEGHSYLHIAIRNGYSSVVEQLGIYGIAIEQTDGSGNTALQLAIFLESNEMVRILLDKGANPNALNLDNMTALHSAAKNGHVEILRMLLEREGFVNNMDGSSNRYTPLDYAEQNNHSDCANLLMQHGGITIGTIESIAATCIQNTYRNYRAKKLLRTLKKERRAACIIQHHVRGFLVKRWYSKTIKAVRASTKLQAVVRGFLQRRKFKKLLQTHRLEESHWEVINQFNDLVQNLKNTSVIKPISLVMPEQAERIEAGKRKIDEQIRRERSLQMRKMHIQKQENWKKFREAEQQRRIDKAYQEKMDYMNGILKEKQERRQHFIEHFQYTNSVRSHFQAASVIQRSYKRYRERINWWKRVKRARDVRDKVKETFAASVIQNSWRRYKKWKQFEITYMCSVRTDPVVQLSKRPMLPKLSSKETKSYERSTMTSGIGRRKLHRTTSGGFKIFRPIPIVPSDLVFATHAPRPGQFSDSITNMKQSRRMKNMKTHWPWIEKLSRSYEDTRQDSTGSAVYSNHGTFLNSKLKMPRIN